MCRCPSRRRGGRSDFVIMARATAMRWKASRRRWTPSLQYVEAGADMIFAEALTTLDEYRQFTQAVKVPVLANITEFGKTPLFTTQELGSAGVRLVLYPLSVFRAMSKAAERVYGELRKPAHPKGVLDSMQNRTELYDVLEHAGLREETRRNSSRRNDRSPEEQKNMSETTPGFKPQKSGPVRRHCRQHCPVHGRPQRQRPALPRLRHPRHRRQVRLRGSGLPTYPRQVAEPCRAQVLQSQAEEPARSARDRAGLEQRCRPPRVPPMDVMRTGASALGCSLPEKDDHNAAGARDIADRLVASFGSMLLLLVPLEPQRQKRIEVQTMTTPWAGTSCTRGTGTFGCLGARHARLRSSCTPNMS